MNIGPLALFHTVEGALYFLWLQVQDVFHVLIVGSTGSGKSFLGSFLLASAQKFNPLVFVLDMGGSYRRVVRHFGGKHFELGREGDRIRINPFSLPPSESTFQFLFTFVKVLLGPGELDAALAEELFDSIKNIYYLPPPQRRLKVLAGTLPKHLVVRLARWCEGGQFGWVFDNEVDELSLARLSSIDFQGLERAPDLLESLLFYTLHRVRMRVEDAAERGRLKICLIDEAWRFFRHPAIRDYVLEAIKTWRKWGGAMILTTQSGSDLLASELLPVVCENVPTKIFLANPGMDRDAYQKTFHLKDVEAEEIMNLQPKKEFLVKRPNGSKVLRLSVPR